ncbi:hypothetical protein D3C75_580610 [compost metagenome]
MGHGAHHSVKNSVDWDVDSGGVSDDIPIKRRIVDNHFITFILKQSEQVADVFIPIANLDRRIADRPLPHDDLGAFCITMRPVIDRRFAKGFRVEEDAFIEVHQSSSSGSSTSSPSCEATIARQTASAGVRPSPKWLPACAHQ